MRWLTPALRACLAALLETQAGAAAPPDQAERALTLLGLFPEHDPALADTLPPSALLLAENIEAALRLPGSELAWRSEAHRTAMHQIAGTPASGRQHSRARYQKGLLAWLRATDAEQAQMARAEMQAALSMIRLQEEAAGAPSFWAEQQTLLQALPTPPDEAGRRLASRIEAAMRQEQKGTAPTARTLPAARLTLAAHSLSCPGDFLAVLGELSACLPREAGVDQRRILQILEALAQQGVDKLGTPPAGSDLEIGLALSLLRDGPLVLTPEQFAQDTDTTVARLVQLLGGEPPGPAAGTGWLAEQRAALEHRLVSVWLAREIAGLIDKVEPLLAKALSTAGPMPDRDILAGPLTTLAGLLSRMGHFPALGHLRRLTARILALTETDAPAPDEAACAAILRDWALLSLFADALASGPQEFNSFVAGLPVVADPVHIALPAPQEEASPIPEEMAPAADSTPADLALQAAADALSVFLDDAPAATPSP